MPLIKHLKDTEPFNHLPDQIFQEIRAAARTEKYPPNTYIFRQNAPPTGFLYVIKEGLVEITVLTPGGGDMVLDYRQEGTVFGGTPIFTGEPYTGGARTVKATECYLIPQEILKRAEADSPRISEYFTRIVHSRVRRLYHDIVSDHTQKALTQVEAYPFKKRLSEIMVTPVEACPPDEIAQNVARRIAEKKIGSVLVVNEAREPIGIITDRDLVTKVIAPDDVDCKSVCAREIMTPHPHFMSPDTYMYEAMSYMIGHRIKNLPVVDRGEAVGMVSLRDLMRYRSQKAMLMIGNIQEETSLENLAAIRRELVTVARSLLSETRSTPEVMEILSYIHHGIIKQVYELCLEEMRAEGKQPPDIRFCFLIMGSGGRREMLLSPDQDNGFIFENVPDERMPEIDAFFVPFAEKLVQALNRVGYPLCHGKVMANNPSWRGRLRDWQARIKDWVNEPEPQKVRYSSIFFDFTPLAGDPSLAQDLREIVHCEIREFQGFLYHMMSLDLRYKVPVGLLGRFILEKSGDNKGELSLKQGGSIYIVDCIRMFALEKERSELTTMERLKALVQLNVFDQETAEHIRAAFEALSFLRLRNEIALIDAGRTPTHHLDPYTLSKNEQDLLKEAFHAVSKLQDATKRHFGRTPF
ncbi:MAG: cyclic nucleotide-binding protein [Desulfuromonas sp.]|uniref:putative nucleotidyltransferase substrate binding domain-containing protein n=1 Tax=Desulfuromonas sp. TaxID=892 RepID=UPI000CBB1099|nr:putative nucleotidyltransferase substrate binding domain-containing protein [Desulfuromonas sp.]PLX82529.1 MAG: cyclic nucleotide-binding protein [Desulfuromonas sp.]